jgi:hypothetical protein
MVGPTNLLRKHSVGAGLRARPLPALVRSTGGASAEAPEDTGRRGARPNP